MQVISIKSKYVGIFTLLGKLHFLVYFKKTLGSQVRSVNPKDLDNVAKYVDRQLDFVITYVYRYNNLKVGDVNVFKKSYSPIYAQVLLREFNVE